jgi:hypothetical protein
VNPFTGIRNIVAGIAIPRFRLVDLAVIVLAGAAVYSHTLNVPFVLDDNAISFFGQRTLQDILLHGGSRRVADFTFALNLHLHGIQVTGYHLVNLTIHLAAAVTVYCLVDSALAALRRSFPPAVPAGPDALCVERFVPLAVALLFAVHPLQTQAVTYIIQRYTSLATLFYLLSALFFIRARLAIERGGRFRTALLSGSVSLLAGLLALGSKQIAATLPVMLAVLEIFLFRGRMFNRRFFVACGAMAVLVVLAALIHWQGGSLHDVLYDIRHATAEDPHQSRIVYFLTQTRVVATYLRLLCLPLGQNLTHDAVIYTTLFSLPVLSSLALHVSLAATALLLYRTSGQRLRSNGCSQGALQRLTALGIVWFYCTMAVESSLFPIRDLMFEHRIYLPSTGFFLTTVSAVALAAGCRHLGFKAAWTLLAAVCLVLGGMTLARNNIWNDRLALWQDTVNKSPGNALAMANLGGEYLDRSMQKKALPLLVRALEIKPNLDLNSNIYLGRTLQGLDISRTRFTTGEELVLPGNSMMVGGQELEAWRHGKA